MLSMLDVIFEHTTHKSFHKILLQVVIHPRQALIGSVYHFQKDKNNLSIVRFATNLDSRRTSKDYWSFEEPLSTPSSTPM